MGEVLLLNLWSLLIIPRGNWADSKLLKIEGIFPFDKIIFFLLEDDDPGLHDIGRLLFLDPGPFFIFAPPAS